MTPIHQLMCFLLSVHTVAHALIALDGEQPVALSVFAVLLATLVGIQLLVVEILCFLPGLGQPRGNGE